MRTLTRSLLLALAVLAVALAAPAAALAQTTIAGFFPTSGAPGDVFVVHGTNFPTNPGVTIGGVAATVLRSNQRAALARVPTGAVSGTVSVLDGTTVLATSTGTFTVLASADVPCIVAVRPNPAPADSRIAFVGRRLRLSRQAVPDVFLEDGVGTRTLLTSQVLPHFGWAHIPAGTTPGFYKLIVHNGTADNATTAPTIEIVAAAGGPGTTPTITGTDPASPVAPGTPLKLIGSYLGRGPGQVRFVGTGTLAGTVRNAFGVADGFRHVHTFVPPNTPATTQGSSAYDIEWTPRFGPGAATFAGFQVKAASPPVITDQVFPTGALTAGRGFVIKGTGFFGAGRPSLAFDAAALQAVFWPGRQGEAFCASRVPSGTAAGPHDLTVTTGAGTSPAFAVTVQ